MNRGRPRTSIWSADLRGRHVAPLFSALVDAYDIDEGAAKAVVSDRQWRDIRGVIRVQGAALDREYLERHATSHRVFDLRHRALNEE